MQAAASALAKDRALAAQRAQGLPEAPAQTPEGLKVVITTLTLRPRAP